MAHLVLSYMVVTPQVQYRTEGGGRDLTGSPKLLDGKRNKLLKATNMGHEAICFRIYFNIFTHVSNIVSVNFAVLIADPTNTVLTD